MTQFGGHSAHFQANISWMSIKLRLLKIVYSYIWFKKEYLNLMQFSSLILCISACSRQLNIQQFPIRSDLYFSHDCHNSKATNSTEMHFDKIYSSFPEKILNCTYRGSSPYANFIIANFITAIFQNFPDIWLMRFWG